MRSRAHHTRRPRLELLESRHLMTAAPAAEGDDFIGHGRVCNCPVCAGVGLDEIPAAVAPSAAAAATSPLSSLPRLSSRPSAAAKLFLDFNGHSQASWGSWSGVSTPAYDQDGNGASFSSGELASIREIWARVAEDYAPLNIDVTTIDPLSQADRVVAHVAIGGHWSDWYGHSAGGVAYSGGFYNGAPNVGYVFENVLGNGNAKYVAEAAAHEAGHLFGLTHQAKWSGTTLAAAYSSGTGNWAPIMGVGYYAPRTTWHDGPTARGPAALQDDLSILAGTSNGFGYRPDDHGDSIAAATRLAIAGNRVSGGGLVGQPADRDVFSFTTGGGAVNFTLSVNPHGPNLDGVLELWNSAGSVLATAAPGASLGASLSHTVGAGTFYVVARGMGDYGDVGQYSLVGTVPAAAAPTVSSPVAPKPAAPQPPAPQSIAPKQIIDNGAPGTSIGGAWTRIAGKGYESDIHSTPKGNGTRSVSWLFTGLPNGQYNAWATWTPASNNATNAPYSFYNGTGPLEGVRVNQRQAPTVASDGARWKFLTSVSVVDGWAMVKLANNANGTVVADAIRLVQVTAGALIDLPSVSSAGLPAGALLASSPSQPEATSATPEPQPIHAATDLAAHDYLWSHPTDADWNAALSEETLDQLAAADAPLGKTSDDFVAHDWLLASSAS